jgi:hypothetical protein
MSVPVSSKPEMQDTVSGRKEVFGCHKAPAAETASLERHLNSPG